MRRSDRLHAGSLPQAALNPEPFLCFASGKMAVIGFLCWTRKMSKREQGEMRSGLPLCQRARKEAWRMSTEDNKAADRRYVEEVLNRGNLQVIDELRTDDVEGISRRACNS